MTSPTTGTKRGSSSEHSELSNVSNTRAVSQCPVGAKKLKTMSVIETVTDHFIGALDNRGKNTDVRGDAIVKLMQSSIGEAKLNRETMVSSFREESQAFRADLKKNAALRALTKIDLKEMSDAFQERAKKTLEDQISSVLEF